ncbi:hypothetical protein [Mycobacterium sp. UM_CSW]|uniref:hypothetical protein n=1 Tax=Mycobacterium sp. UM_CSW TaxID=1370119 RepID=UPI0009DBC8F9|nr:hypothetical protein [Mycobacterium sp. UM_CSW]
MVTNGTGLRSQVWDTQVRLGESTHESLTLDDAFASCTLMGKRYRDGDGTEVLVTRAGKGSRRIGTTPAGIEEAKPLPASDCHD